MRCRLEYTAIWTQYLKGRVPQISIDAKRRALDNVWIERLWKSLKYDYVYLNPVDDGFELFEEVQNHIYYYHQKTIIPPCKHPKLCIMNPSKKRTNQYFDNQNFLTWLIIIWS